LLFEIAVVPLTEADDVPHISERNVPLSRIQMLCLENELAGFRPVATTRPRFWVSSKDTAAVATNSDFS